MANLFPVRGEDGTIIDLAETPEAAEQQEQAIREANAGPQDRSRPADAPPRPFADLRPDTPSTPAPARAIALQRRAVAAGAAIAFVISALIASIIMTPSASAPAVTPATALPTVTPANALPRALVAYSAPEDGAVLGAVDAGRIYTPTMRLGAFVQAEVADSGAVWLRLADLDSITLASVPEATPTPSPVPTEPPPPPPMHVPAPAPVFVAPAYTPPPPQPPPSPYRGTQGVEYCIDTPGYDRVCAPTFEEAQAKAPGYVVDIITETPAP